MNTQDWMNELIAKIAQPVLQTADLEEFQSEGVMQLVNMIQQFGGALLADGVGLGKTRMSVHAATRLRRRRSDERPILICCGARIKEMWQRATVSVGLGQGEVEVVTHTAMSRASFSGNYAAIIVDEAHHFRNPNTKRYACLEKLSHQTPLLLVTATPVVNSVWDLYHLLRLFLADHDTRPWTGVGLHDAFAGAAAGSGDVTELLRLFCVRREQVSEGFMNTRPDVALAMLRYAPADSESWIWENLETELRSLHLCLLEGDWPRGLFVDHVLRAWEGGPHALQRTLSNLAGFHTRWLELDSHGRHLDRSEFGDFFGDSGEQAVLHFMFEKCSTRPDRQRVQDDEVCLRRLENKVQQAIDEPGGITDAIAKFVEDGRKCLIFATFQRSAEGLFRGLRHSLGPSARIGLITGSAALSTGIGKAKGEDLLARFAPHAHGVELASHQELQILICTDCLSEGVNLQDCDRVIFLDLPWTPHAIEQRIGRLVRPGSQAACVQVLLPRPHQWNDTLGMRRRLMTKLRHAETTHTGFSSLSPARAKTTNPLEALTQLDRLAATTRSESHEECPRHGRVIDDHSGDQLWLLLKVTTNEFARYRVVLLEHDHVEARLECLMPEMIRRMDRPQNLVEAASPPPKASQYSDHLWENLQGATSAPVQLEAIQLAVWHRLSEHDRERSADEWSSLRAKLLAPLTRGQLARLHELMDSTMEQTESQILAWRNHDERVVVELIATLEINPEATATDGHP